jgi:alpha-glucosidase
VPEHRALNVARQNADRRSTLNNFRAFLRWRREQPLLLYGDIRFLDVPEPVVAFERTQGAATLLAAFNLSAESIEIDLPGSRRKQLEGIGLVEGRLDGSRMSLPAHGVVFAT